MQTFSELCTKNDASIISYNTHHMKSFNQDPSLDVKLFYDAYYDRKNAPWDKMYANYNAAVDWPTAAYWEELHEFYPDAKVILTVRSAESWYKSVNNTIRNHQLSRVNATPDLPDYTKSRMQAVTCMDGRLETSEFDKEEEMKQIFLDHNEYVKKTVPEDKLLVMELGEGWDRLCKFLGKEVPDVSYPHVNSTAQMKARREARMKSS